MPPLGPILRLLRPGDWTKNVFVLIPVAFWAASQGRGADHEALHRALMGTALAFIAFCAASSGWYCINDSLDADQDRLHPKKGRRPVASGAVSKSSALMLGGILVVAGLLVAWSASRSALVVMGSYVGLQLLYNMRLKRTTYVDVAAIATGFCLRAVEGAAAAGIDVSAWLLLCTFFLTLYLGLVKRMCDLSADAGWTQRAGYGDHRELDWLLGISACLTVVLYMGYTMSEHADRLYGSRALGLALLSPLVLLALHRFHRRALMGLSDSPLAALREDAWIRVAIGGWVIGAGAALYWPPLEPILQRLHL